MQKNDQQFIAQEIRAQYTEKPSTELDALKSLDAKVKRPANIFGWVFGAAGSLVMGVGMCFAMDVIEAGTYLGVTIGENMMLPGIVIGLAGIALVSLTYPIYKKILNSRKKKYAGEIIKLSEKLMEE